MSEYVSVEPRNWERNPRKGILQPKFLCHRFPIKGGMTANEVFRTRLVEAATKRNPFLEFALRTTSHV